MALGALFLSLREILPLPVSVLLGQTGIIVGWMFTSAGTVTAAEKAPPWRWALLAVAGALIGMLFFLFVRPDFQLRTVAVSLPGLMFDFYVVFVCLKFRGTDWRGTTLKIIALALSASIASSLLRISHILSSDSISLFDNDAKIVQYYMVSIVVMVVCTVLYVLLAAQKTQEELAEEIREHKKTAEELRRSSQELEQSNDELATHRNRLEELVLVRTAELTNARDAAEAGNRAKTRFLANMSHELRTPMNGVMGMIDLALRRANDSKQIDMLNKGKGAALRMITVVNDIIDFSKAEADRLPLEDGSFSMGQMIDDAIAIQESTAQTKGLNLTREIPAAFPDQLLGDAFHLRQILLNFLGNACKFSDQGTITVRVTAVEQDCDSVLARIEVEDQGIGVSYEQQAMLFQAFTQVDDSMTRKYGGSGLGLVIAKRLANLMGGDVGMVSQLGRGSTFWVTVRLKLAISREVGLVKNSFR